MAKPEKRKIQRGGGESAHEAETKGESKFDSGRVTRNVTASTRYTPPSDRKYDMPSPPWVPVLMFSLLALGIVTIILNYVELLPGAVSNGYLLLGLAFILAGIITATQYR